MMNDHEKSHVVMQAWRFNLKQRMNYHLHQPKAKIAKKKKFTKKFLFWQKIVNE